MKKLIVCGAGAAGMAAAIMAARKGIDVTVIEKTEVAGKKLTMTGNGRCNLTNEDMSADCYNPAAREYMDKALHIFSWQDTVSFFESMGLITESEEGYLYPVSGQATTVRDIMLLELERLGVEIIYGQQVKEVLTCDASVTGVRTDKGRYPADHVILAMGGKAGPSSTKSTGDGYYIAGKAGLSVAETRPALTGLLTDELTFKGGAGVRSLANISLCFYDGEGLERIAATEYGEVQLTDGRISGIPAMQLSRQAGELMGERPFAEIDFLPAYTDETFEAMLGSVLAAAEGRTVTQLLSGVCNSHLAELICRICRIAPDMKVIRGERSADQAAEAVRRLRKVRIAIKGLSDYDKAQVTTGGVELKDLSDDLEAANCRGLYVIGELADVDGRCGGYNLQWAWTSAYIAGRAICR
ncbi:aminoacetone oxidase family FAD-binding enzyme [Butyrivibrio sp. MC2013]|uniref:aminoacetone oxidase family FAD-binding enzyme n=1 Tax=Butyrivibrio sp. MC2013 TaxID=1280686 RepID=UPI000410D14E|nr:aminoacetone oxidase family FAD-binding enzyme [Butyrivibrio sp. MC2013]